MALNLQDWLAYTKAADLANVADERFNELRAAWDAYYGRNPKPLAVEQRPGQPAIDDNIALNCTALIVDEAVSALTGNGLIMEIEPVETSMPVTSNQPAAGDAEGDDQTEPTERSETDETSPEELWWEAIAKANRFDILLHNTAVNGAVCGHMYWKISPKSGVTGNVPRIINLNPAMVSVSCNEEDMAEVWAYCIRFEVKTAGAVKQRLEVIAKGEQGTLIVDPTGGVEIIPDASAVEASHWTISDYDFNGHNKTWVLTNTIIWPYPFAPIVDAENLPDPCQYYGKADLTAAVIEMDKAVDRAASIINRVCRVVGFPRPIASGISPNQAAKLKDAKIGEAFFLESKDAKITMLEMAGDLTALANWYKQLKSSLLAAGAMPDLDTDKMDSIGKLSALAMKILFSKQERRVMLKRLNFETLISETIRRLRVITNQAEAVKIEFRWPSVIPANTKEDLEVATMKNAIGVSKDTLVAELGYDAADEAMKREDENSKAAELAGIAFGAGNMGLGNPPPGELNANG